MESEVLKLDPRPWQEVAAGKRKELYEKIPKEWRLSPAVLDQGKNERKLVGDFIEGLLDSGTLRITSLDAVDIIDSVRNGSVTAVAVTQAFCKRAAYAHQLNNNLLEIAFDIALARAEELDSYFEEHHETIGPLHGLPVSMKDQFHIKGVETTMAYVGWIGTFEGRKGTGKEGVVESELVRELYSLGAIPIVKTSCVQTLWCGETNNNIVGYTLNPWNQKLSSGGSSGGEGALQALRGSVIGFGTDIAFQGLYSIKPSHGRISYKDAANSSPGQVVIPSVVGIIGTKLSSVRLMFESLLTTQPWLHDPDVLDIPWRSEREVSLKQGSKNSKPVFGLMTTDGIVSPHPPIARALRMVAEALQSKDYEIIPWSPPSHSESTKLHPAFTEADGAVDVFANLALSGEPLIPELRPEFGTAPKPPLPLLDFYNNSLQLKDFRERYQDYWSSTAKLVATGRPVDAVILPVTPHAAVIPGKYYYYTYSSICNVLDYPSVVIPVTFADSSIDSFDNDYKPFNDKDKKNWRAYDPEIYHGAPASIQILGRRLEEEKLLLIAQTVVDALEDYKQKGK